MSHTDRSAVLADGVIDDDELDALSKNDLREMIEELNKEVLQRDQDIQDLTQQLESGKKRRGKGDLDRDLATLESQIAALSDKYQRSESEREHAQEELANTRAQLNNLSEEKKQLELRLKSTQLSLDRAEEELSRTRDDQRKIDQKTKEDARRKKDSQTEHLKLFEENEQLQSENKEILRQLEEMTKTKVELEALVISLHAQNEELSVRHDTMESGQFDLNSQMVDLERQLHLMTEQYDKSLMTNTDLEKKISELNASFTAEKETYVAANAKATRTNQELKQQITMLMDSTQMGELQRAVEILTDERDKALAESHMLAEELESLQHDKDLLSHKLVDYEDNFGDKVFERIAQEKETSRLLNAKLSSQAQKLADEHERNNHLESEKDRLLTEKEELENWKTIYERGHGMQELAKHQKKLKEDNRRVGIAMEQMTRRLGEAMDTNSVLFQAFERLKLECGKPKDFMYPEYQVHEEMLGENALLQAQIRELEDQIDSLESETIRLRRALKNQAGLVGEQGFKYQGMTADMLVKVNEFASNLRDGNVELPLDDRSSSLLRENKKLREEIQGFEMKIERYEREYGLRHDTSVSRTEASVRNQESEIFGLREDLQRLIQENNDTKRKMSVMQDEVVLLLKEHLDNSQGHAQVVHTAVIEQAEKLLQEMNELRKSGTMMPGRSMSRPSSARSPAVASSAQVHQSEHTHSQHPASVHPAQMLTSTPRDRPPVASLHSSHRPVVPDLTPISTGFLNRVDSEPHLIIGNGGLGGQLFHPVTPHGKKLLSKTLNQLNLPPEEWAEEVKNLNAQLIECLEQLYERETECEEQRGTISSLEDNLVNVKQQVSALYYDFAQRAESWEAREKQMKSEAESLLHKRDDLELRLKRTQELIKLAEKEDPELLENKVKELGRKVLVYEVNEAVLSRKYTSLEEQLNNERESRQRIEIDMAEMETTLKKRILYLEQYKLAVGSKLGRLQGKLDLSVPVEDFQALQKEIENLREDHLSALRREVEAKISTLQLQESSRELRAFKLSVQHLKADLHEAQSISANLALQLAHQQEATAKALAVNNSTSELSSIVSEMARFRGEASRLEVEVIAANRRRDLVNEQLIEVTKDLEVANKRIKEYQASEDDLIAKENQARKELLEVNLKYNGGLPRQEAEDLKSRLEQVTRECYEIKHDTDRYKELAEIASHQAQILGSIKSQRDEEFKVLSSHCAALESRGDDDILIGRLQRQLIAVKTSYKAFTRKYQMLRKNMVQRELHQRVLETTLDQREEAMHIVQESHRLEVGALKRAIRSISEAPEEDKHISADIFDKMTLKGLSKEQEFTMKFKIRLTLSQIDDAMKLHLDRKKGSTATNGQKLLQLSAKVGALSELAEESLKTTWEYEERNRNLNGELQDSQAEKELLAQKCQDLEAALNSSGKYKQQVLASRLVSLSEDVRSNKLVTLQQRRQINVLRQEKKHLQNLLVAMEADVENLEEGKIIAETKSLLTDPRGGNVHGNLDILNDSTTDLVKEDAKRIKNMDTMSSDELFSVPKKPVLRVVTSEIMNYPDIADMNLDVDAPSEELVKRIEDLAALLADARRDASSKKIEVDTLSHRVREIEKDLSEKDSQINYYESVMEKEGLPSIRDGSLKHAVPLKNKAELTILRQDQEKLQEAANATIGSLKTLLMEKNKTIEKYRSKIEELQAMHHKKSHVDRKAEELLRKLDNDENKKVDLSEIDGTRALGFDDRAYKRLQEQVEAADDIISDKDKTIQQLEQKLSTQSNQRERAEVRCGAAIQEMEAMKADMITLVQQLKESEERYNDLSRPFAGGRPQDSVLEKRLKSKDEKLQKYREIIVKLKEEFINSEEAFARKISTMKDGKMSTQGPAVGSEELKSLKEQVVALRDGLKQAKRDLEEAIKKRESISKAKKSAEEEVDRLESVVGRAEAQASSAQDALQRCRKELEESKKKEMRLRDKLKDLLETDGGPDKLTAVKSMSAKIEQLEREAQVLRAQNIALRKAADEIQTRSRELAEDFGDSHIDRKVVAAIDAPPIRASTAPSGGASSTQTSFIQGKGYILGSATTEDAEGTTDELKQQLKAKWENEKKLQRRVTQLEHRLKERMDEIDELQNQLKKAKDSAQNAIVAKEEYAKKLANASKLGADTKRPGSASHKEESGDTEEYKQKIFDLEEAMQSLRRRAEVELPGEVSILRHQVSAARARIGELEAQLQENEERRRKERNGGGGLRDSEDRFMREEKLRDELDSARRQRLDLEAALLERDSKAMEHRFDLEARAAENDRIRRRLREVEVILKTSAAGGAGKREDGSKLPSATAGSKKEKELEGVIEAMKRVIDKLKAENDRMKKTGGPDERKVSDAEKRAALEKKRADKLEEDNAALQAKLKTSEKGSQELTQKQQQLLGLRKALKAKDDELTGLRSLVADSEDLKAESSGKIKALERKCEQLEEQLSSRNISSALPSSVGGGSDMTDYREKMAQQAIDMQILRAELDNARREITNLKRSGSSSISSKTDQGSELVALKSTNRQLSEENEKLKQELSAFDLDFFEEIENLKFAHAEAIRKLRIYEGRST